MAIATRTTDEEYIFQCLCKRWLHVPRPHTIDYCIMFKTCLCGKTWDVQDFPEVAELISKKEQSPQ